LGRSVPLQPDPDHADAAAGEPGFGTTRYDDWLRLVITHEYTHVLQLDMASKLPLALRSIFGRLYFPNALQPEWLIEGLATFEETELTAGGRGRSPGSEMVLRLAALEGRIPTLDEMAVFPMPGRRGRSPTSSGSLSCAISPGVRPREDRGYRHGVRGRPLPFSLRAPAGRPSARNTATSGGSGRQGCGSAVRAGAGRRSRARHRRPG